MTVDGLDQVVGIFTRKNEIRPLHPKLVEYKDDCRKKTYGYIKSQTQFKS